MDKLRRKLMVGLLSALFSAKSIAAMQVKQKKSGFNKLDTKKVNTNSASKQKPKTSAARPVSGSAQNALFAGVRLGINLASIADWGTEFPFVDLFKQSRAWFVDGGDVAILTFDAHGWISQLPAGMVVSTIICSLDSLHFPADDYVILYDGEGDIHVPFYPAKLQKPGRITLTVDGKKGLFRLDITKTNPQNYIKNIRVIPKHLEATYQQNLWNSDFLSRWQGVASIRYMDFMVTNNSLQMAWAGRPQPSDASYAQKGVPLELMIDLANRLNAEPWFCLPHMANDDYIKQFAMLVKANLKPNLRAWVEYSNEVWNGGFEQNAYAAKQGQQLKFAEQAWEAACKFTAHRSVQIFNIWTQVFGQNKDNKHNNIVRVLASQAANIGVAEQILSFKQVTNQTNIQAAIQADVLAIAPYINFSVPPNADNGITDKVVANWNLDKLFDELNKVAATETLEWIQSNKKITDQYGLKLVAYEAGQHLVGVAGAVNNEQLTNLFLKANADVRMGELYTQYLAAWANNGGDLLCQFNSVSVWSKWGSWGLLQYNNEPTPKFNATINWANAHGQKMRL